MRWPASGRTQRSWSWRCATRPAPRATCSASCGHCRTCAAGRSWRRTPPPRRRTSRTWPSSPGVRVPRRHRRRLPRAASCCARSSARGRAYGAGTRTRPSRVPSPCRSTPTATSTGWRRVPGCPGPGRTDPRIRHDRTNPAKPLIRQENRPRQPTAPTPPPTPRHDVPPLDAAEPDPPPDSFARLWGLARPVRSGAGAPGGG